MNTLTNRTPPRHWLLVVNCSARSKTGSPSKELSAVRAERCVALNVGEVEVICYVLLTTCVIRLQVNRRSADCVGCLQEIQKI